MEDTAGPGTNGTAKVHQVAMTAPQPFIARLDSQSIRIFLKKYDAYVREMNKRTSQRLQADTLSLEPISPVPLTYCVDAEKLESAVELGRIDGCTDIKSLTDEQLRKFMDEKAVNSASILTETDLANIVQKKLRMDMSVKSATDRMELLFIDYMSLLRQHKMKWVVDINQKTAVKHVLSAIKPVQLRSRLEQDISFSKMTVKDDFKKFMAHAIDLSEALEKLETENRRKVKSETGGGINNRNVSKPGKIITSAIRPNNRNGKKKLPPTPCPLKSCEGKGHMHWVEDCKESTAEERKAFKDMVAAKKARDGPSRSGRYHASSDGEASSSISKSVGRLRNKNMGMERDCGTSYASCIMTVSDYKASIDVTGHCNEGSEESIASTTLAERATIKGIGKIEAIELENLEVYLTKIDESPKKYKFSRAWCVPSTVLHFNSGSMALKNIRFLVPDDALVCEDLLIGRKVLLHLRVDTRTLLEERMETLDGTDCSPESLPKTNAGRISRLMVHGMVRT